MGRVEVSVFEVETDILPSPSPPLESPECQRPSAIHVPTSAHPLRSVVERCRGTTSPREPVLRANLTSARSAPRNNSQVANERARRPTVQKPGHFAGGSVSDYSSYVVRCQLYFWPHAADFLGGCGRCTHRERRCGVGNVPSLSRRTICGGATHLKVADFRALARRASDESIGR
jgi:hypothetical protein